MLATLALTLATAGLAFADRPGGLPEGTIVEIRVEGNATISTDQVRSAILSKQGSPLDQRKIEADIRTLSNKKWFSSVEAYYEKHPKGKGYVLIFIVKEMPILKEVEFRGRKKVRLKDLEEATSLKAGARADASRTRLAVGQIQRLYAEKGYDTAEVRLVEGGEKGDTKVVFEIFEGEKHRISSINFEGNVFASDGTLQTKITSKPSLLGVFFGKYHRDALEEDTRKLIEYYQGQGFFEVSVRPVTRSGSSLGDVRLTFVVSEGTRYTVRNIQFEGNKKLTEKTLRDGLLMHSGQPVLETLREADRKALIAKYNQIGCIDTQILPEPKYTDLPGVVDLVYKIEEGEPYLLGDFIVRGNERTKDKVIRREAVMAGLLPGEVLDLNRIEIYKNRLGNTGYFGGAGPQQPGQGNPIEVKIINKRPGNQPYGDGPMAGSGDLSLTRMQNGGPEVPEPSTVPPPPDLYEQRRNELFKKRLARRRYLSKLARLPKPIEVQYVVRAPANRAPGQGPLPGMGDEAARARMQDPGPQVPALPAIPAPATGAPPVLGDGPEGLSPFGTGGAFDPPPNTVPPIDVAAPPAQPMPPAGLPGAAPPTPPVGAGEPPGEFPSIPGQNLTDVGPDRQDPFPNRSFADVVTSVSEAPTGRFMLGIGASGFQGLNGSVTVSENNFNLFNVPRSLDDFASGKAFRGGGQNFQLSLMAGTLINRFSVSLRDPYLFDLPIGGNASGYLFQRIYPDWTESRAGGRFGIGRQFGTSTYADVAFRVENVQFYGYRSPAPADYLAASGHSLLASLRPTLRFDNRNSPFLPNKGQYLEFAFEQGWGTFYYPKAEVEGRKYFTTGSRPDGSGPRILALRGHFGVTGRDTPVYERFYAGYLGSLRGFQYRGVGPHVLGANVGGVMMFVGSLEYSVPLTASDSVRQVFFTDFGTVEGNYDFNNFRASVGTGLRLKIPAMGPLPLAFDLAFPVAKAPGDKLNYFAFSIGAFY